jgi:(p)ppGpp synthase/HD superfamily hydrolase
MRFFRNRELEEKLIRQIEVFATLAHNTQKRKYTGDPYFCHPIDVEMILLSYNCTFEQRAVGLLHDVIEDTFVDSEVYLKILLQDAVPDLKAKSLNRIVSGVLALTEEYTKSNYPHFNRATRKKLEAERLSMIEPEWQTVKYADIIDNSASIIAYDPNFAVVYIKECTALLQAMDKGDKTLRQEAFKALESKRS